MADPVPARSGRKKPRARLSKAPPTTAPQPAMRDRAAAVVAEVVTVGVEQDRVVVRVAGAVALTIGAQSGRALEAALRPRVRRALADGLGRQPDAEALRVALDDVAMRVEQTRADLATARASAEAAREAEQARVEAAIAARLEAGDALGAIEQLAEVAAVLPELRRFAGCGDDADFAACVAAFGARRQLDSREDAALALLVESLGATHMPESTLLRARQLLGLPVFERDDGEDGVDCEVTRYEATPDGMVRIAKGRDGEERVLISNFLAQIVSDVVVDDGVEQWLEFELRVTQGERTATGRVKASDLGKTDWAVDLLGSSACVSAGPGMRDHTRAATQLLSKNVERRVVHAKTGWADIDGVPGYLHGGGAITGAGLVDTARVELPLDLAPLRFDRIAEGEELIAGINAVHDLLRVAGERLIWLLLGVIYRSVLPCGPADLSLWLEGGTGRLKTSLAVVFLQFFGRLFSVSGLPNWSSTPNALEATLFTAKDALVVIDDAAPDGTARDRSILAAKIARVLRAQGNHAGRGRANIDGSLRGARPPRGMVLVTAEDVPIGASVLARTVMYTVPPQGAAGSVDSHELRHAQRRATEGVYAATFARFIQHLAQHHDAIIERTKAEILQERAAWGGQFGHLRTPSNVAHLLIGWREWLRFAVAVGAMDQAAADAMLARVQATLVDVAVEQDIPRAEADPVVLFRRYLASALGAGLAHIASPTGLQPDHDGLGWQPRTRSTDAGTELVADPRGDRVGWLDGRNLYLDLDAALRAANAAAGHREQGVPIGAIALGKRLRESGLMLGEKKDRHNTTRRQLEGTERRVYHVDLSFLDVDAPAPTRETLVLEPERTPSVSAPAREGLFDEATAPRCPRCDEAEHLGRACDVEVW